MLKSSFKQNILEGLNYKAFRITDFTINDSDKKFTDEIINTLVIYWLHDKSYYYEIVVSNKKVDVDGEQCFKFKLTLCPGEVSNNEKDIVYYERHLRESITKWLDLLQEEILSNGSYKLLKHKIEEQEALIEKIKTQLDGIEDDSFTEIEEEQINNRLDEFKAEIKKLLEEKESENKKELNKMYSEIEFLKSSISQLKKKEWLKLLAIKFLNWSKDPVNRKLLITGANVAKQALPDGVKEFINIE